jgi:LmbE family N-acetylglucosaminyl deacetylase
MVRWLVGFTLFLNVVNPAGAAEKRQLKVMVIFAHPDEGEIYTGGTAALYTRMGHKVKFLSITNGDAGHYSMKADELAKVRFKEAMEAKQILGLADYEVLDHHDGVLRDTPEVRAEVAGKIETFQPDVVFSYYPAKGGHNDNMAAGWIVRNAAPSVRLDRQPVYFYVRDYFTSQLTYVPDVAIAIDSVWDTKIRACTAHQSQVADANPHGLGILEKVRADPEAQRDYIFHNTYDFSHITADNYVVLQKWYGPEAAKKVKYIEAFEIAEYGRQIREAELHELLPMVGNMITVPGKTQWLDTGLDVTRGREVDFLAEGSVQWNEDGHQYGPPSGAPLYARGGHKPIPGINTGALIGKIGADSAEAFYIGPGNRVRMFSAGRLFLGINDDNVSDNAGAFRVWITFPEAK